MAGTEKILSLNPPEFMAFFFPAAHAEIDWSKGYESLDQELQKVVREAESRKRYAGKLIKVWRHGGEALYVVIHIEIQGGHDKRFPLRMYIYNYRLFDRHQQPVVSLAVLCDDSSKWRPEEYSYELWGCRASLSFPVVKLRDYTDRWAELEESTNPFAIVVMSHLKSRATRGRAASRLRWKIHLVRLLYEGGWERQDVLELLRFIDWVLKLPPWLESRFDGEIARLETEKHMRYVTSWERKGLERGLERGLDQGRKQGFLQGEASVLKRLLKRRFERLPEWVEKRLDRASRDELEGWTDRVIEAKALEDVFA